MEPSYFVGGIKNCVATLENNLAVFKMLNVVLQYGSEISLLGILVYKEKLKYMYLKNLVEECSLQH